MHYVNTPRQMVNVLTDVLSVGNFEAFKKMLRLDGMSSRRVLRDKLNKCKHGGLKIKSRFVEG